MKISNLSTVASTALATALLCLQPSTSRGGGQGFSKEVMDSSKETYDSKGDLGLGRYESFPFQVSVSVRGGYDDNVNLTQFNPQESFFTNASIGVTYDFGSPRTRISLNSGAGFTYYFDRDDEFTGENDDFDVNAFIGFAITHKATPRLTLAANLYATYMSQPDFQTFNNNNFTFSRQSQDFFFTLNKFSVGYAWTPRFSTVSSYTLGYTNYDDEIVSQFQDRFEHTIGNEFRFLVWPTTTLVAEYRFGIVDYTEMNNRNSTSHYLLGGFDHSFSPRFNISTRAGVEFRSYDEDFDNNPFIFDNNNDNDQTSPYAELTLNYALAQNTQVSWSNRYSIEESDVPEIQSRQTYRTALSIRHSFTSRISAGLNFAYQNDDYDGNFITPGFNEDSFDISLSVRYAITRNWAFDAGYHHTEVISNEALFREYSRNRYYAGFAFTF
ncbi:MAG: outer membrane beta-barrel protein [Limisphaerales bacterium]